MWVIITIFTIIFVFVIIIIVCKKISKRKYDNYQKQYKDYETIDDILNKNRKTYSYKNKLEKSIKNFEFFLAENNSWGSLKGLKKLQKQHVILYSKKTKNFFIPVDFKDYRKILLRSGIYIIYFNIKNDERKDEESIPCYIGQSKNIINRWMRHIQHLENCQNGERTELKYNKILNFAKQNNLKISNLRFSVLEYNITNKLNERELFYINEFGADQFGWNWNFR